MRRRRARAPAAAGLAAALCLAAACGPSPADGKLAAPVGAQAIVGARPEGHPGPDLAAVGAVVNRSPSPFSRLGDTLCSGVLVAESAVLTAAHCLAGAPARRRACFSLAPDLWGPAGRAAAPPACLEVVRVVCAEAPASDPRADVALAFLEAPAAVEPARLAHRAASAAAPPLAAGQGVFIAGYGVRTGPDAHAWADDDGVRTAAPSRLAAADRAQLVVGGPGLPQRCFGDSGGPTFAPAADGGWWVVGVGVRPAGRDCIDGGVEARIDALAPWLDAHLGEAAPMRAGR